MGRERIVVVEIALLLLGRELITEQEHGQHRVRLLDHLLPVEIERMVVQQQRVVFRGRGGEVPPLLVEEAVVLWVDTQPLVLGEVHALGRLLPHPGLLRA